MIPAPGAASSAARAVCRSLGRGLVPIVSSGATTGALLGVSLAALLLAGCGFHLRGSRVAAGGAGTLFVDVDRDLTVEETLRAALRERGFVIAGNRDEADVVLRVADERQSQRIVSVLSTGRVSEYELAHAVSMSITRPAENAPAENEDVATDRLASDRVEVTREYTYDESQVLGKENEARILRSEMSEELVSQVVLRTIASLAREVR